MSYELRIDGLDELKAALSGFSSTINKHIRIALSKSLYMLQGMLQEYPPRPPTSTYIRTGTLGRRWMVKVEKASLVNIRGFLENPTEYGPYVQDQDRQANIHRGRWRTIQGVLLVKLDEIYAFFRQAIKDALRAISRK